MAELRWPTGSRHIHLLRPLSGLNLSHTVSPGQRQALDGGGWVAPPTLAALLCETGAEARMRQLPDRGFGIEMELITEHPKSTEGNAAEVCACACHAHATCMPCPCHVHAMCKCVCQTCARHAHGYSHSHEQGEALLLKAREWRTLVQSLIPHGGGDQPPRDGADEASDGASGNAASGGDVDGGDVDGDDVDGGDVDGGDVDGGDVDGDGVGGSRNGGRVLKGCAPGPRRQPFTPHTFTPGPRRQPQAGRALQACAAWGVESDSFIFGTSHTLAMQTVLSSATGGGSHGGGSVSACVHLAEARDEQGLTTGQAWGYRMLRAGRGTLKTEFKSPPPPNELSFGDGAARVHMHGYEHVGTCMGPPLSAWSLQASSCS